jgi:uncharacterized membrane protein (DUF373 family)
MEDPKPSGLTRDQWSAMTLYEKFEQVVIFVLSAIIAVIVVASLWALLREVMNRLVLGAFGTLDYATFQVVFGMIFTVVIALEFKRSLLVATERSFGILQVRTIVLIALLAIARKFIILDLGETEPAKIAALGLPYHPRERNVPLGCKSVQGGVVAVVDAHRQAGGFLTPFDHGVL